jgi:hypothetical protein
VGLAVSSGSLSTTATNTFSNLNFIANTTTTVVTSGSPITYGDSVTFTANIAPASGSTVPTGAVQFYTNGVALGSPVTVTTGTSPNGTASLSTTNLPAAGSPHTITANYIATGSFASSSDTLSGGQAVNKATATVTVTPYSVTYDGLGHTATAGTVTGVNGEKGATVGTVILSGTTHTNAGSYPSDSWTLTGGANYNDIGTTVSNNISKVTPTVLVTGGIYTNSGSPQGPNTFTTIPAGDTGTATWSYVGVNGTAYGPSATRPAAAGYYTAQVTALTADANFNSSASSATAFSIINIDVLFSDNYTVTTGSYNIDFQNTLGRETGTLSPLLYMTRYVGANAYRQQLGNTNAFTTTTNALFLFGNAGVRIDYDFSSVGAPLDVKFSAIVNWYGLANTNTITVGNRSDGYDPTNAVFAFQLCKSGTNNIFNNGVATAGASGNNFGDNVPVNYEVVLSDTAGTGSPFGSGGSKAAYYQGGTLLGTATLSQLTAGQGYIGFVGGQGNVGEDNLQISSISAATISLTGSLGAVNTTYGAASASPTSFTVSGSNLTGAPGNLTVTPPAGFEVSLSSGSGYSTNLAVSYSSGILVSTNVYVRLAATTAVGSYSGNITVVGGGDAKAIATASSTVSPASAASTNAYLVSLVVNPAVYATVFASNVLTYSATNYLPSNQVMVTVTNADLTATNTLTYNGTSQGILASGSPSSLLTLAQGAANVVKVLVTAQDGLTTNLYAVNVTLQPNQTQPHLTNSVNGGTNLVLNWPSDHTGWRLLVQTNNLQNGVSSNTNDWATVANSSNTNQVFVPIVITNRSGFYRMVYP